jgi:hypothetical protein
MLNALMAIGIGFVILGAFLLSPAADFLPISIIEYLESVFLKTSPNNYYRIVVSDDSTAILPIAYLIFGGLLIYVVLINKEGKDDACCKS